MTKNQRSLALWIFGALLTLIFLGAVFFWAAEVAAPSLQPATSQPAQGTILPTNVWDAFLEATPFAYFTPLPEPITGAIDGFYAKIDQSWPQWWKCLRCADYRPAGGIWRLQFDRGVMRIFYEVNNWRSIASYTVSGDRLFIFNDPYCPEHTGEYQWAVEDGELRLDVVNDPCAFDLRAENLTTQSWLSCTNAAPGCELSQQPDPATVTPAQPLEITVYGGDSRFFETPPDVIAHANSADTKPPEGISITFAEESIPYGLQRVLWWNGSWIEASFDSSYESMGVQFLGEEPIGWARLLFDGQEIWRGKTSAIWTKAGRHGGYVEVSGFGAGEHTLRVESMGFDFRPVTVANFGFSEEGGVNNGDPQK